MMKIGFAKDIHKLYKKKNRALILGTINIKNKWKIKAHSDGDIILHSLSSAILSILDQKTLGELYPETKNNKNINSSNIFRDILKMLLKAKIKIQSIDITIICQKIILKPYLENIKNGLKSFFNYDLSINIKATRFENKHNKYIECYTVLITK